MSAKFNIQTLHHTISIEKKDKTKQVIQDVEYPEALKECANQLVERYGRLRTLVLDEEEKVFVVVRAMDRLEYDKAQAAQVRSYDEDNQLGVEQLQLLRRNMAPTLVVYPPMQEYLALDEMIPSLASDVFGASMQCSRDVALKMGKGR